MSWLIGSVSRCITNLVLQRPVDLKADDESDSQGEVIETGAADTMVVRFLEDHRESRQSSLVCQKSCIGLLGEVNSR